MLVEDGRGKAWSVCTPIKVKRGAPISTPRRGWEERSGVSFLLSPLFVYKHKDLYF